jgi:hypothetical protein
MKSSAGRIEPRRFDEAEPAGGDQSGELPVTECATPSNDVGRTESRLRDTRPATCATGITPYRNDENIDDRGLNDEPDEV